MPGLTMRPRLPVSLLGRVRSERTKPGIEASHRHLAGEAGALGGEMRIACAILALVLVGCVERTVPGPRVGDRLTVDPRDPLGSVRVGGHLISKEDVWDGIWYGVATGHDCVVVSGPARDSDGVPTMEIECTDPLPETDTSDTAPRSSERSSNSTDVLIGYMVPEREPEGEQ